MNPTTCQLQKAQQIICDINFLHDYTRMASLPHQHSITHTHDRYGDVMYKLKLYSPTKKKKNILTNIINNNKLFGK